MAIPIAAPIANAPNSTPASTAQTFVPDAAKLGFFNDAAKSDILRTPGDDGSKYDTGFINQLNLQDYRADNQPWTDQLMEGGARLVGGTLLKASEGFSVLGSAIGAGVLDAASGINNLVSDDKHQTGYYGITDITDNPVNNIFYGLEDMMKAATPIYKNKDWANQSLLQQMGSSAWWTDEGVDVLGFALSNFLPAGAIGDLGLGAKLAGAMGADLTLASDATSIVKDGGFFSRINTLGTDIGKTGKLGKLANDVLIGKSGLGSPVQFAKNIDNLAQNAYMTTSEAYFMSRDAGVAVTNNYLQSKGIDTSTMTDEDRKDAVAELKPEEQQELIAKKAQSEQYTFWSNMAALTFASKVEQGFINKIFGHASADAVHGLVDAGQSLGDVAQPIERTGVDKFLNGSKLGSYVKNIPKFALLEGGYKANIQNAIQTVATQFGYNGKADYIEQVLKTAVGNLSDPSAYRAMGANLVVGTLMGAIGGAKEFSEQQHAVNRAVTNINSARENMVNLDNVLYQKDDSGQIQTDANGRPIYNVPAITDFVANQTQAQDLAYLHDIAKNGGDDHLATVLKNEAFTKYALAHLESGLGDELTAKVKAMSTYSDDDMAKLGFDPIDINAQGQKVSIPEKSQALLTLSNQIKSDYARVTKTVAPLPDNNARINESVKLLSRARTLDGIHQSLTRDNQQNLAVLTAQNSTIAEINNKAIQLEAGKQALSTGIQNGNVSAETATRLALQLKEQERELIEQKNSMKEELTKLGYNVTNDATPIDSEINNAPEMKSLVDNHFDAEDAKIAKLGQIDQYNRFTNFKDGAKNFTDGIVAHKAAKIVGENQESDADEAAQKEVDQYNPGDYVSTPNGVSQLGQDAVGNKTINGQPFDKDYLKNNPSTKRLSEQEANDHVTAQVHQQKLATNSAQLNLAVQKAAEVNTMDSGDGATSTASLIPKVLNSSDVIPDVKSGKARLSEKDLQDQINSVKQAQVKLSNIIDAYKRQLSDPNADATTLQSEIQKHEDSLARLQKSSLLLEGLQSKLPNTGEQGQPTTDTKEIQLNQKQAKQLESTLDDIKSVNYDFEKHKTDIENQIKDLQLKQSNLTNLGPLQSEHITTASNPISINSSDASLTNEDAKPSVTTNGLNKTAGSHFPGGRLNEKVSQKSFFKYTEEYDPKTMKNHRLRIVTISDPEYGLNGTKGSIYNEDDPKYHTENNVKVLVVDGKGNPIQKEGNRIHTSLTEIRDEHTELGHFKWSNGEEMFRGSGDAAKDAIILEDYRNLIKQAKNSKKPVYLNINGKSNGILIKGEPIAAEAAFGKAGASIRVITDPKTTIGGKDFALPQGFTFANYRGRPVGATLRLLNLDEQTAVLQKLKDYAKDRGDANAVNNGQTLRSIMGTIFLGERGLDNTHSIFFVKGKDLLSFGDNLISHEDLISSKYDEQLKTFLADQLHQANYKILTEKSGSDYTDIHGKNWRTYEQYLLKDRGEDTPLRFEIQPFSTDINKPQFKNTYLTFNNPKFEAEEVKPQAQASAPQVADEAVTIQPYVLISNLTKNDATTTTTANPTQEEIITRANNQRTDVKTTEPISSGTPTEDRTPQEKQLDKLPEKNTDLIGKVFIDKDNNTHTITRVSKSTGFIHWDSSNVVGDNASLRYYLDETIVKDKWKEINNVNNSEVNTLKDALEGDDLFNLHEDVVDNYVPSNPEEEEKWFKENISTTLPYQRVKSLIDRGAYGKFDKAGRVLVSDLATKGTSYHEGFHVVTQLYLNNKERNELYQNWRDENHKPSKVNIRYSNVDDKTTSINLTDNDGREIGHITFTNNYWSDKDNFQYVSSIGVKSEFRGNRVQDVLYQLAIDKAKELGYNGVVSGENLVEPDITTEAHNRFENNFIKNVQTIEDSSVSNQVVELTGHKNKNIVKDWIRDYEANGPSDRYVEEQLAEEFREFMLTDYSPSKNRSIFQKIADFIKNLIGISKSDKQKLFQNIGDGKYLDSKIQGTPEESMYSVAKAFSASTEKDLFDSMTLALLQNMKDNNFTVKDLGRYANGTLDSEDAKRLVGLYNTVNQTLVSMMSDAAERQSNGDFLKNQVVPYIKANAGQIAIDHMKYLGLIKDKDATAKINFKNSLDGDKDVPEMNENEREKDTLGIIDSIQFSAKSGMPNIIKLMIAGLPKTGVDKNGNYFVVKNNLGLPTVSDYKRNINILINELSGLSSLKDQISKVTELRSRIPEFKRLLEQLGVTRDGTLSPSATADQFDLQSKFRQQFDKNYYNFYLQLHEGNNSYMVNSNVDSLSNAIKARWQKGIITNKDAVKSVNGQWVLDSKYFDKKYSNESLQGDAKKKSVLSFYKDLGIVFSRPDLVDIDELADKQNVLLKRITEDNSISDIFEGTTGWINSLIEQELKTSLDYADNQHINPEGKTVYNVSLNDYLSQTINEINNHGFPDNLQWDEEGTSGNPLVRNSVWKDLVENKGKKFQSVIIEGSRINETGEVGQSTSKLSTPDVASQQFTAILNGIFPFMRASDKALEKGFSFGDKAQSVSLEDATKRFSGYLADEMLSSWMHNVEGIGKEFTEYSKSASDLRIFKGILNAADEKTKNELLNKATTRQDAIKLIDKFVEQDGVKKSLQDWMFGHRDENLKVLQDNQLVKQTRDSYSLLGIPTKLADKFVGKEDGLSEAQMKSLVEQFTIHQLTSNIEQTKLFTGDLAFYKDFFKRTSGLVGTGKTTWTGADVDEWLNTNRQRTYRDRNGDLKIDKQSDGKLNTWMFKDVKAASSNLEDYVKNLTDAGMAEAYARKLLSPYGLYEEADAQSYATLPEYREFLTRVGDWTGSHEAIYNKLRDGEALSPDELGDFFGYSVLKPQLFGPQEAEGINAPTFYKTSLMPLIPSLVKGTQLEELMHTMHENGIGISIFQSGSKVANKEGNQLYNENGKIKLASDLTQQVLDYKHLKVQLDIDPNSKNKVVFGTQFRKLVLANLAGKNLTINGKLINGQRLISAYSDAINKATELETKNLIERLGMVKVDDNTYKIHNLQPLRDTLVDEAFNRNSPDNVIDGIKAVLSDGDQKPIDVLVNRNKIENILMSMVDNNLIKQKFFGDARVQGASTGFEKGTQVRTLKDAETQIWWSKVESADGQQSGLSFYKGNPTGTEPMDIYLPHYFKEYLGKNVDISKIDKRLLQIVGYRIPTQAMHSIELMNIKGFLPPEAGNLVIVPSEIVAKAGSDFDIDKLNLMFNNYTKDANGNLKYLEYKGNEDNLQAVQNRINDLAHKIVSAPENFSQLITPTSSAQLKTISDEVSAMKGATKSKLDNGKGYNIAWAKNLSTREDFLDGKDGIGQGALHNVHHVLSQIVGLKAKPGVKIYLDHNDSNGQVDFSKERSVGGTINQPSILETLSSFLNAFVDAAKDPFLKSINANTETIGTYAYLVRAGVPIRQVIMFMNQPIISDYLQMSRQNGSQFLKSNEQQLFPDDLEKAVRALYTPKYGNLKMEDPTVEANYIKALETQKLENNIKGGDIDNATQQQILTDYLNYSDASDKLGDLIKATTPDTRGTGATMNSAQETMDRLDEIKENTIFEDVDKFIDDTFLKGFHNAIGESLKMYKPLFFTEINEAKQELGNIKEVLKLNRFADREKALNLVKNDLINFTLQNTKTNWETLGSAARELFSGENSLPKLLGEAKENDVLANNLLIRELYPIISKTDSSHTANPQDLDNLKTFNKKIGATDANLLTEAWRELFKIQPDLAEKLVNFSILQSGLNNSPISFAQFMPNEEYIPIANDLIGKMKQSPNFEGFGDKFFKNNYRNNDLVPKQNFKSARWDSAGRLLVRQPQLNERTGEPKGIDRTQYPYLKIWNKLNNSFDLYQNTGEQTHIGQAIFEKTNKLGDGYNLREWGDRSIIASNNLDGSIEPSKNLNQEIDYTAIKRDLYQKMKDLGLNTDVEESFKADIEKASTNEELAEILKNLCE